MKVTHLQEMDFFCFLGMNFLRQTNLLAFIQDTVLYSLSLPSPPFKAIKYATGRMWGEFSRSGK